MNLRAKVRRVFIYIYIGEEWSCVVLGIGRFFGVRNAGIAFERGLVARRNRRPLKEEKKTLLFIVLPTSHLDV